MGIEILGMNQLLKKLSLMGGNKAIMKGIEKGALRVEADAKRNATPSVDTNLLRGSITHKLKPSTLSAIVGTNVEYATFVEFGTVKQRAQPYLYPALQSNITLISEDIMSAIREDIGRL